MEYYRPLFKSSVDYSNESIVEKNIFRNQEHKSLYFKNKQNRENLIPESSLEKPDVFNFQDEQQVPLPDAYQRFVGREVALPLQDLRFFEGLLEKYGFGEKGEDQERREFGEEEFFSAAHDMQSYAMKIREEEENESNYSVTENIADTNDKEREELLIKVDKLRPSSARMQVLSHLFLHQPFFKSQYMQIHAQKMEYALPGMSIGLDGATVQSSASRDEYFTNVLFSMSMSMIAATSNFEPEDVAALGFVIGAQEHGYYLPQKFRVNQFAVVGVGTFNEALKEVVDEAVDTGDNVNAALRREFLDRDGVGFQLMRTHIHHFVHRAEPAMEGKTLDEKRAILAEEDYLIGACPAILKVESLDGTARKRPIAYEFAAAIVDRMPKRLLQRDHAKYPPALEANGDMMLFTDDIDWAGEDQEWSLKKSL